METASLSAVRMLLLGPLQVIQNTARLPCPSWFDRGFRFHTPLTKPDGQISHIRLSDRPHAFAVPPERGQAHEPEVSVKVREWISPALARLSLRLKRFSLGPTTDVLIGVSRSHALDGALKRPARRSRRAGHQASSSRMRRC
jgi:hypothetical protein